LQSHRPSRTCLGKIALAMFGMGRTSIGKI
jgi:hypothetical protein